MRDINLNDASRIIRVDISTWTARAKMTREDLPPGIDLPPEDLATLGTKRLYDPQKMRIFGALRARARTLLTLRGTRFLDAYVVDERALPDVTARLDDIRNDFRSAVRDFLNEYERESRAWANQHPQWEHIIRSVLPDVSDLARRFRFTYQVFRIAAEPGYESGLADEVAELVPTAVREISQMVSEFLKESSGSEWTKRRLASVARIVCKVESAAFLDPRLSQLAKVMRASHKELESGGYTDPATVSMFEALLMAIKDEHSLDRLCSAYAAATAGKVDAAPKIASVVAALDAAPSGAYSAPAPPATPPVPVPPAPPATPPVPVPPAPPATPPVPVPPAPPATPPVPVPPATPPVPVPPAPPATPPVPVPLATSPAQAVNYTGLRNIW